MVKCHNANQSGGFAINVRKRWCWASANNDLDRCQHRLNEKFKTSPGFFHSHPLGYFCPSPDMVKSVFTRMSSAYRPRSNKLPRNVNNIDKWAIFIDAIWANVQEKPSPWNSVELGSWDLHDIVVLSFRLPNTQFKVSSQDTLETSAGR